MPARVLESGANILLCQVNTSALAILVVRFQSHVAAVLPSFAFAAERLLTTFIAKLGMSDQRMKAIIRDVLNAKFKSKRMVDAIT